jgi:hypothetical protein
MFYVWEGDIKFESLEWGRGDTPSFIQFWMMTGRELREKLNIGMSEK